jgi:hypothetical protein
MKEERGASNGGHHACRGVTAWSLLNKLGANVRIVCLMLSLRLSIVDLLDASPKAYDCLYAVYARGSTYREGVVDFPFWGHSGLNTGVLLLDLARLHDWGFAQRVQSILTRHQLANSTMLMELPDNSVLNAVFAMGDGPEAVVELDTRWDYM